MASTARRPRRVSAWALVLAGAGLAAAFDATRAASLEQDPAYQRLEGRVGRVERALDNQGLVNLQSQLDRLQRENQALRDEVERLRHDLDEAGERQRQQYVDLDRRLQAGAVPAAAGAAAGAAGAEAAAEAAAPAGADRAAYQAAFDLLKQGRYEEAGTAFRDFLRRYPGSGLADNAQYWLGESYYVSQKYPEALVEFEAVPVRYPESRKLPDALLKAGFCHFELKQWPEARKALTAVTQKFAGTQAARLAQQRLDQLTREGH